MELKLVYSQKRDGLYCYKEYKYGDTFISVDLRTKPFDYRCITAKIFDPYVTLRYRIGQNPSVDIKNMSIKADKFYMFKEIVDETEKMLKMIEENKEEMIKMED